MTTPSRATSLAVLSLALLLAGCGGESETEAPAPAGDTLTVAVRPQGPKDPPRTRVVDCATDPACGVPLKATPPTTACTEIYGGDATATVTGTLDGQAVDAEFSLVNGCEIDRWNKAAALLGDPPAFKTP